MPVSVRNSPFDDNDKDNTWYYTTTNNKHTLRVPQARVLAALVPEDPTWPETDWPLLTRANLGVNAGYTAISGTVTRALNGIKPGSSSGDAHPGLLTLGYIQEIVLDVEGVQEVNYRATKIGVVAYLAWTTSNGNKLPEVKDRVTCINDRYRKDDK